MKKILYLSIILVLILSCFSVCLAATFYDTLDTKYEGIIEGLAYLKIVNGTEEHIFEPNKSVTRAEMAKMLVIAHGYDKNMELMSLKNSFKDVKDGEWYTDYISLASAYGLLKGYPDGKFYPDREVTYAEVVAMILRSLGHQYINEDSEYGWAYEYMNKMRQLKLNEGVLFFLNDANATRGDVAIFIWNMLNSTTWHVVKESEKDGLTYVDSKEVLFDSVFGSDYELIDNKKVKELSVQEGNMYVKLEGKEEMELEGVLPIYALGASLSGIYDKEDKKLVSYTYDIEYSLVEGNTKDLEEDGYKFKNVSNKIFICGSKNDYAFLLMEREGSQDVIKRMITLDLGDKIEISSLKSNKENLVINDEITINDDEAILLDGKKVISWNKLEKGDQILCVEENALYLYVTEYKEIKDEEEEKKDEKEDVIALYYISDIAYGSRGGVHFLLSNGKESERYFENISLSKINNGDLVAVTFESGDIKSIEVAKEAEYEEGTLVLLTTGNEKYENHMLGKYIISDKTEIYKVSKRYANNSDDIIESCTLEKVKESALENLEDTHINILHEKNNAKVIFIEKEVNKFSVFYARVKEIIIDGAKISVRVSPVGSAVKTYETIGLVDFDEGDLISYTLNDKDVLRIVEVYRHTVLGYDKDLVVKEIQDNGKIAILQNGLRLDTRDTVWNDKYEWEDYKILKADVKYNVDAWGFTSCEFSEMSKLRFKVGDRIAIDELEGVVVVYSGYTVK